MENNVAAVFGGECPKDLFLMMPAQVPGFGAILVQNFAVRDLQAVRNEVLLIVVHDLQFTEHPFSMGWINFLVSALVRFSFWNQSMIANAPRASESLLAETKKSSRR